MITVVAVAAVGTRWDLLRTAPAALSQSCPTWVLAAVALECASLIAYALLQRRLLRAGGAPVRLRAVLCTVVHADAIASLVPVAGSGLAMAFAYRDFRRGGADAPSAALTPPLSAVFSAAGFAGLLATAAILAGGLPVGLGLLAAVGLAYVLLRRRLHTAAAALRTRLRGRFAAGQFVGRFGDLLDRCTRLRIGARAVGYAVLCSGARWSADALCLAAAIAATGVGVPWDRLVPVWAAGAVVTTIGLTPGGLGTADAVLVTGMIGTGMAPAAAGAAAALYRIVALKPVPRLAWLAYRHRPRRGWWNDRDVPQ